MTVSVTIHGLKELQRALKRVEPELAKTLRTELKAAAEIVASDARGRVPRRSGRAAGSVRAGSTMKGAYVAGGKSSVPYYGWLDFGSRRPISGRSRSVGPWKGTGTGPSKGRFIYPALSAKHDRVTDAARRATSKAIDAAGF